jgi:hypothetical protein
MWSQRSDRNPTGKELATSAEKTMLEARPRLHRLRPATNVVAPERHLRERPRDGSEYEAVVPG